MARIRPKSDVPLKSSADGTRGEQLWEGQQRRGMSAGVFTVVAVAVVAVLLLVGVLVYGVYQQQAAQAAQVAAQATQVALQNEQVAAQATAVQAQADAQATAVQAQADAQQEAANAQATATQQAQDQTDAQATAQANQGQEFANLPSGQCVLGMPNHDMRIAVSGNGAEQLCRDLIAYPIQGIGPVTDYSSQDTYDSSAVTLSLNDGTSLRVVCQYNLPSTIVQVFDDGLVMTFGKSICHDTTLAGVSAVSVG